MNDPSTIEEQSKRYCRIGHSQWEASTSTSSIACPNWYLRTSKGLVTPAVEVSLHRLQLEMIQTPKPIRELVVLYQLRRGGPLQSSVAVSSDQINVGIIKETGLMFSDSIIAKLRKFITSPIALQLIS